MIFSTIVVTLLVCLVARFLAGASRIEAAQRLAEFMIVPIVPLLMIFFIVVALRVSQMLTG
jgi:ABC-type Na+ efflux pump permease subunit